MGITIKSVEQESWDDRIKRLEGWDPEKIKNSVVLVAGAGAIGNETLKNLSLLGFGHIIICDLDIIELTNLTRTVLFSEKDLGLQKAFVAGEKIREMNLEPTSTVDVFCGDIVYGLGDGVFRMADIVLGCLDNMETRAYINNLCIRYEKPYIDAGIGDLSCSLKIMNGHNTGCLSCYNNKIHSQDRFRVSCDISKRKAIDNNKTPTVQTTSAIVSGLQVQETLKCLCNINPQYGKEIYIDGRLGKYLSYTLPVDKNCWSHLGEPYRNAVVKSNLSNKDSLETVLRWGEKLGYGTLTLEDEKVMKHFVTEVHCPGCGVIIQVNKPLFSTSHDEWYCENCREKQSYAIQYDNAIDDITCSSFSLSYTPETLLKKTLEELGIPGFHVIKFINEKNDECMFAELYADFESVLPELFSKKCK